MKAAPEGAAFLGNLLGAVHCNPVFLNQSSLTLLIRDPERMVETAAHLVDHVLPRLPVHQWVLPLPKRLRYFLLHDARTSRENIIALFPTVQLLSSHSPRYFALIAVKSC
jgi:hypothetical protein